MEECVKCSIFSPRQQRRCHSESQQKNDVQGKDAAGAAYVENAIKVAEFPVIEYDTTNKKSRQNEKQINADPVQHEYVTDYVLAESQIRGMPSGQARENPMKA